MAEVVKRREDGSWSVEESVEERPGAGIPGSTNDDLGESIPAGRDMQSAQLSEEERDALVARERERMADPGYPRTLEDPTKVIEALLRHHGRG